MIRRLTHTWMREMRFALRRARARPGPGVSSILMLGLGIGASTAAFSAVRTVLLEPLPMRAQDELVVLWRRSAARDFDHVPFAPADFMAVERAGVLAGVAALETAGARLGLGEGVDGTFPIRHARVGGDWFGVLGVEPVAGRVFDERDDAVGATPAAVISHPFWVERFGGSRDAIGAPLRYDGVSFTVVGVAPPGFDFPAGAQAWATFRGSDPGWDDSGPAVVELDLVGRMRPAATVPDALSAVERALRDDLTSSRVAGEAAALEVTGATLPDLILGPVRPVLLATLAGALVLLLVAIGNSTLLFLTTGVAAAREVAIRRAIGASPGAAVRPLVADGLVRALVGWGAGLALAWVMLRVLTPLVPGDVLRAREIELAAASTAVLGVGAVSIVVVAAGLAARWLSAGSPADVLTGGHAPTGRPRGSRVRGAIVAGQVGLAVVTGAGAILLTQTVRNLAALDHGFEPAGLHVVDLQTPWTFFEPPAGARDDLARAADDLSARAGISGVSPTFNAPMLLRGGIDVAPRIDGQDADAARDNPYVGFDAVLPRYFEVAGTRIVEGRAFGPEDGPGGAPSIIVNRAAARALWPGRPALGRQVNLGGLSREEWRTVVGVVEDHRFRTFPDVRPAVYIPLLQYERFVPARLLLRTREGAGTIREAVDEELARGMPGARVLTVRSMQEVMQEPLERPLFASTVLVFIAVTTVILSGLGVHGVVSATVAARRRELGVRIALGAGPWQLLRSVLLSVIAIGLPGAVAGALVVRWLGVGADTLLFGVSARDPLVLGGVVLAGTLACLVFAAGPAARALRTNPGESLRVE